jgi:5-methylcytosine-specific restriction protein B
MLRYFAFPERVERISSSSDLRRILVGFEKATRSGRKLEDRQLDAALWTAA